MFKWFKKKDWRLIAVVTHGTKHLFQMDGYNESPCQADFHFYENEFGGRKVKVYGPASGSFNPKQSRFWGWCNNWKNRQLESKEFPTYKMILEGSAPRKINTGKGEGV